MKKLLFILVTVFIVNASYGQKNKKTTSSSYSSSSYGFDKGNFLVSGVFGFKSTGGDNGFGFEPRLGYFINDKFLIGASIGYRNKFADENNPDGFSVGFLGRYYVTQKSQFSLFGQAGLKFTSVDGGGTNFGFEIAPGVNYFVSNHFTIEATLGGLGISNNSPKNGDSTTNFALGLNLNTINFGLGYKF
jgi:opacity protein-like surface antigen